MLSTTSKYALRAVVAISQQPDDALVLGRELATKVGIPRHYLSKVLGTLTRIGILAAARGTKGGYRLARSPAHIALAEIVEAFGASPREPRCVLDERHLCGSDQACKAHTRWAGVQSALTNFLEGTHVADLSNEEIKHGARGRKEGLAARGRETSHASLSHRTVTADRVSPLKSKSHRGGTKHG